MKQLSDETATLLRQEIELAKAEVTDKAKSGRLTNETLRSQIVNFGLPSLSCRTENRRNNCDAMMKKPRKNAARRIKKLRFR